MGIDTEIPNEHLRKHTSAKNPYIWTFDPRSSITCPWLDIHQDQMVYNDLSEKMRHIPRFNPITTPNPLLAAIDYLYRFIVFYTNQKVAMVTLVLDKKKYVPKEKKLEQDRRREVAAKRHLQGYSPDTQLQDLVLSSSSSSQDSSVSFEFNPQRLMYSHSKLIQQFVNALQDYLIQQQPYLSDLLLDIQEDQDIPLLLPAHTLVQIPQLLLKNQIGESEVRCVHFAKIYAGLHPERIPVFTFRDTDVLPLTIRWLSDITPQRAPPAILWIRDASTKQYKDENHIRGIDLQQLNLATSKGFIQNGLHLLPRPIDRLRAFVLGCIIGGTDYNIDKGVLCHQFGIDKIFQAIMQSWSRLSTPAWSSYDSILTPEHQQEDTVTLLGLSHFVYALYGQAVVKKRKKIDPDFLHVRSGYDWVCREYDIRDNEDVFDAHQYNTVMSSLRMQLKAWKGWDRHRIPYDQDLRLAHQRILFNWKYWAFLPLPKKEEQVLPPPTRRLLRTGTGGGAGGDNRNLPSRPPYLRSSSVPESLPLLEEDPDATQLLPDPPSPLPMVEIKDEEDEDDEDEVLEDDIEEDEEEEEEEEKDEEKKHFMDLVLNDTDDDDEIEELNTQELLQLSITSPIASKPLPAIVTVPVSLTSPFIHPSLFPPPSSSSLAPIQRAPKPLVNLTQREATYTSWPSLSNVILPSISTSNLPKGPKKRMSIKDLPPLS